MNTETSMPTERVNEAKSGAAVHSSALLSVSFGFGTNSTALLCGLLERDIKPDVILAADTGAEMPHSYRMLETMQAKVRAGTFEGLDGECMRGHKLPALAYGWRWMTPKSK